MDLIELSRFLQSHRASLSSSHRRPPAIWQPRLLAERREDTNDPVPHVPRNSPATATRPALYFIERRNRVKSTRPAASSYVQLSRSSTSIVVEFVNRFAGTMVLGARVL